MNSSIVKFWLPKERHGTQFKDLDLLPTLLAKPKASPAAVQQPLVQEISENTEIVDLTHSRFDDSDKLDEEDDENDRNHCLLEIEQHLPASSTSVRQIKLYFFVLHFLLGYR
jgi:hypothetical protein